MAGYFHGAGEIQADGLQTLYLMNPSFMESSNPSANMVLLNSSLNPLNPMSAHNPNPNHSQQLVGIPLQPPPSIHAVHEISNGGHGLHYNLWTPAPAQQGLSLSLSPQQGPHMAHRPQPQIPVAERELSSSNAVSSMQGVLMGSTYLKAAQQLLDEVVSVGGGNDHGGAEALKIAESKGLMKENASPKRAADLTNAERQELQMKKGKLANMLDEVEQRYRQYRHQMQIVVSSFEAIAGIGSARTYTALALRTISKQFRSLRDAIYGQIRHTSRSLGEDVGLTGGTKSGGSRLRFIDHHLRQQRALQQIGMIQQSTWRPQRGLPERAVSVLRAWLFEHFLHPYPKDSDKHMLAKQTGLTRSQVSNWFINARVRLWKPMVEEMYLEESKDQEQNNGDENTSNHDDDEESMSSAHHDKIPTITEQTDTRLETKQETVDNPRTHPIMKHSSALGIVEDHDAIAQHGIKRPRSDLDGMSNRELLMEFVDAKSGVNYEYDNLMQGTANNHGGVFGGYSIGDIRRFDDYHGQFAPRFSGNGVSLTLGLHSENLSLSGAQESYLSSDNIPLGRAVEMNHHPSADYFSPNNNPSDPHPPIAYESINIQKRKRFDSQILQDFVA